MNTSAMELGSPDVKDKGQMEQELTGYVREKNNGKIREQVFDILESRSLSKAASTKLTKDALNVLEKSGADRGFMLELYSALVDWADKNKRQMLKHDLEMRKAEALLALQRYTECLELIASATKVLRRADDKIGLVKIYYLESRVYYQLKNPAKAKSMLTLARSTSTMVYCPPEMQANMDLLNGIYLADERDYKTACSYIIEALEGFNLTNAGKGKGKGKSEEAAGKAVACARYLIMIKILQNKTEEAGALLEHKLVSRHREDEGVRMLEQINEAVADRNLRRCNDIIHRHLGVIEKDPFMINHLMHLCDNLIDSNIVKIIEPYSEINVQYIGDILGFDEATIENRLRRMILDGRIPGSLDQETKCLKIKRQERGGDVEKDTVDILKVLSDATGSISVHN